MSISNIPYEFVRPRAILTWRDIQFGFARKYISLHTVLQIARERYLTAGAAHETERELAHCQFEEHGIELIARLVKNDTSPDETQSKWLFLLLAWAMFNRSNLKDPLEVVEVIYSDLDYPPEIASFVRYMPMVGPDLGSVERNEARMYQRWDHYVARAGQRFSPRSGGLPPEA